MAKMNDRLRVFLMMILTDDKEIFKECYQYLTNGRRITKTCEELFNT